MTKHIWSGTAIAIALGLAAASVAAASQAQPQAQNKTAAPASVTVTGCVQRAPAAPVGTSGTAAAPGDTKFLLTKIGANAAQASPAPAAGGSDSYRLNAEDAKLMPHVGHKVEITGSIDKQASAAASASGPSAAISTLPMLKVDTVRMLATTCAN